MTKAAIFGTADALLIMLGIFSLTLLGGCALYNFVERPCMALSRWIDLRPKATVSLS